MSNYRKGRVREYRAKQILEAAGFTVCRAAGSKGVCDLIAWDQLSVRFVSVKSGNYASAIEREALSLMPRPTNSSAEIWRFKDRVKHPSIERL